MPTEYFRITEERRAVWLLIPRRAGTDYVSNASNLTMGEVYRRGRDEIAAMNLMESYSEPPKRPRGTLALSIDIVRKFAA